VLGGETHLLAVADAQNADGGEIRGVEGHEEVVADRAGADEPRRGEEAARAQIRLPVGQDLVAEDQSAVLHHFIAARQAVRDLHDGVGVALLPVQRCGRPLGEMTSACSSGAMDRARPARREGRIGVIS
jgi:hypothetical protein